MQWRLQKGKGQYQHFPPSIFGQFFNKLFNKLVKFVRLVSSEITPVSRKPENSQLLLLLSHFSTRSTTVNSSQSSQMHEETNSVQKWRAVKTSTFGQERAVRSPLLCPCIPQHVTLVPKKLQLPRHLNKSRIPSQKKGRGTCRYMQLQVQDVPSIRTVLHNGAHLHSQQVIFCQVSWSVYENNIDCLVKCILMRLYSINTNDVVITLKKQLIMSI